MSTKKTLQDIIDIFAEKQNLERKEAELFVKGMFDLIEEALATEKYVKVKGLNLISETVWSEWRTLIKTSILIHIYKYS